LSDYNGSLVQWSKARDQAVHVFGRQALPMVWDYAEVNPLAEAAGDFSVSLAGILRTLNILGIAGLGTAVMADAQTQTLSKDRCVSTDPPYYDNVPYADLSDYFYAWLRPSLKDIFPDLFATLAVPKAEELVAFAYRHKNKASAEAFFLNGMTDAMHRLAGQAHPAFPVTIYYAFKQTESDSDDSNASTCWETFLDAVIHAGFAIGGTWPMRTEKPGRMRENDSNALASSIILVCRPRAANASTATRRDFLTALKMEIPEALKHLQHSNIAPVDLAQAAIGPGMAVYTRYAKVIDAEGTSLSVRQALVIINQTLDAVLAEQEGDFDADSRWALAWFDDHGFQEGPFGEAHPYFVRFNTAENALKSAGIIESGRGKVRLLKPDELAPDWNPATNNRLTAWEVVHQLIRVLEETGEGAAAAMVTKLGIQAELARELAYRLYTMCERKKRASETLSYNALVQSWTEITRLARQGAIVPLSQTEMFS
jgi:putative DNA methylase